MKVERIGGTFAAEIHGLSICEATAQTHRQALYQAYLDHKVIVIRDQRLSPQVFARFGSIFGEAEVHHVRAMRHPDVPTLTLLSNQAEPGRNDVMKYFGDGWHADSSYKAVTAAATMLWGMEIPDEGGDTLFADAQSAYADLPDLEKLRLRQLRVRHQYRWSPDRNDPWARWRFVGEAERKATPEVIHPLVKRHPDTGKESLHIAPRIIGSVIGIDNMDTAESDRLIDGLMEHVTRPVYVYRHRWRPYDIVVWDNRSVLHSATTRSLSQDQVRRMLRITTTGSRLTGVTPEAGVTEVVPGTEFA